MKIFKLIAFVFIFTSLSACNFNINMNSAGGTSTSDFPFYITTQPMLIKNMMIPSGTKLTYEEHFWKKGVQSKLMNENNLNTITFPYNQPLIWGGVPIYEIRKFFNTDMRGFTVHADFEKLDTLKANEFAKIWKSCSNEIGIAVSNIKDWSFNKENIKNIESCGVLYQRYFKKNEDQQLFLDEFYVSLQKVEE